MFFFPHKCLTFYKVYGDKPINRGKKCQKGLGFLNPFLVCCKSKTRLHFRVHYKFCDFMLMLFLLNLVSVLTKKPIQLTGSFYSFYQLHSMSLPMFSECCQYSHFFAFRQVFILRFLTESCVYQAKRLSINSTKDAWRELHSESLACEDVNH